MYPFSRTSAFVLAASLLLLANTALGQLANFSADETQGCFPHTVKFTDNSTGTVTKWLWDFGNNNTSELQNPSAIFSVPGVYNVSLTVSNGNGPKNTLTRSGFIVVNDYPAVDFTADVTTGCAPLSVKFSDRTSTASGEIVSWFWVFGDGGSSPNANPKYVFEEPGKKNVSLTVRNEHGCVKTKTISSPVDVLGPIPKFKSDKDAVCTLPATFNFTNQSTGTGLSYQWNFDDGTTSTSVNPSHTYNAAGTYDVSLKVRDGNGCEQTFVLPVNAGSEGGLDMEASPLKICKNGTVNFKLISSDPPLNALWEFGDGETSTLHEDSHPYTEPGTYTVTLTSLLLDHTCSSVVSKKVVVAEPAVPSFTHKFDCDYNLTLTSTSLNTTRVEWYIGDDMVSTAMSFVSPIHAPGVQNVRLVAFDAADCQAEIAKSVDMPANPAPSFEPSAQQSCDGASLSGCAPFAVPFVNTTSSTEPLTIKWEFGDGGSTTQSNPLHTFQTMGLYQVSLTATNARGCSETKVAFVHVENDAPHADFTVSGEVECAGKFIEFTSTSTGADFWCWEFGDGQTETGEVVQHQYQKPGKYTVTLTAKNAGCTSVETKVNVITIKDPYVTFDMGKTCTDTHTVLLTNNSENYDEMHWEFGDGKISDRPDTVVSYHYEDEATYQLKLVGVNHTTNCTTIAMKTVVIQDVMADFDVNTTKPCKGAPIVFTDNSHAAVKWEYAIAGQTLNEQNAVTKLDAPGTYTAVLTVTDSDGCTDSFPTDLKVLDMEGAFTYDATSDCEVFAVSFNNESSGNPVPNGFEWDFGDDTTPANRFDPEPVHPYENPGEYNVVLKVSNTEGTCEYTTGNAIVFTKPDPSFESAKNEFCPGSVVVIANTSKNAAIYEWDYGDGRRSDFVSPIIPYSATGAYDITLFARDVYGCERKVTKDDYILIQKPTADFKIESASGECPPFTAVFSDESESDIEEWQWDFGDGQGSTLKNPANIYLKPGQYNVSLSVVDDNGCTDTKTVDQFVSVGGPTGILASDGAGQCTNQTVTFTAVTANTATLRWDFGDGNVVETTTNEVSHQYTSAGSFTPGLLLIDSRGCENFAEGSTILQVKDTTAVSITISPSCINTGEPFKLEGTSEDEEDQVTWTWFVDGNPVGDGDNLETTLDAPGMYTVTGLATNKFNCTTNAVDTVRIQGPMTMIPNVITPNGDGTNESFRIIGLENSTWSIDIVNRWGNTVYKRKDYRGDWDGEQQPAGVYFYVLRNAACEDRDYKGFISIVR